MISLTFTSMMGVLLKHIRLDLLKLGLFFLQYTCIALHNKILSVRISQLHFQIINYYILIGFRECLLSSLVPFSLVTISPQFYLTNFNNAFLVTPVNINNNEPLQ